MNKQRLFYALIFLASHAVSNAGSGPSATSRAQMVLPLVTGESPAHYHVSEIDSAHSTGVEFVPAIRIINDPIEPINRAFYGFNNILFGLVIDPLASGYKFICPRPARARIKKAGYNIEYPIRLINCLLQGKMKGSASETGRFMVNTTVGLLGLFDPASRWGMRKYDEDFGKTFANYGAGWGFYFVLPVFGSSSGRDALGMPLDSLFSPASWIYLDDFFMFDELSFTLPFFARVDEMELDPYLSDREIWALGRKRKVLDLDEKAPLPSPNSQSSPAGHEIFPNPYGSEIAERADTQTACIPATGKELPYSAWLQKGTAPLVFVIPGLGRHRLADESLATVAMAWRRGFSVVAISSALNWEFIENAGTPAVPGYTPADARDVYAALNLVYQDLNRRYPGRFSSTALLGVSLGGLHALFIADLEAKGKTDKLHFDRIVAINPLVDPCAALLRLDEYSRAPLEWPAAERRDRMEMALLKAGKLSDASFDNRQRPPFDDTESKYLIGLVYRMVLRDVIYSSQRKQNLGIIKAGFGPWTRQRTYDEIARYSYADYLQLFMLPYYLRWCDAGVSREDLVRSASLMAIKPAIEGNPKLRVFITKDDFILMPRDIEWLKATFGDRLTEIPDGDQLGNLRLSTVQDRLMGALTGQRLK